MSPTYAAEIKTPAHGMGLDGLLRERGDAVRGILNGVDYGIWDPRHDPFIGVRYDARDLGPKRELKRVLTQRLGLADGDAVPLLGVVSRLVEQKGIDLVAAALPGLLADTRVSLAVLGSGEDAIAGPLRALAARHPTRVSFTEGYDEPLAHAILAGSDLTLVPSRYEPCGLTQLYALRFGTIPVVRATGGLADTVRHFDPATGDGTGSVFRDADPQGLTWAIRTALGWLADPAQGSRLVANAMACDFSWDRQVAEYEALYTALA